MIDKPAGLVVPGAGPRLWHPGQRADPALRGEPVGNRRGQAARDCAPARQGHVRAPCRRQDGCGASGLGGPPRRSRPHRLAQAPISRAGLGALDATAGKVDAPIGRDPRHREKMTVMSGERGRRATTRWRLEENLGPASLVACQRRADTTQFGSTWPRSAIRCWVIRCMGQGSRPKPRCLATPPGRRSPISGGRHTRRGARFRTSDDRGIASLRSLPAEGFYETPKSLGGSGGVTKAKLSRKDQHQGSQLFHPALSAWALFRPCLAAQ